MSAAPKSATRYCAFCDKSEHQVRHLIDGGRAFICGECVALCAEIIQRAEVAPYWRNAAILLDESHG
jgi:ATP-dependent protease Clp ATPase subunit